MSFNTILEDVNTDVSLDFSVKNTSVYIIGSNGDYEVSTGICTIIFESSLMNYDDALLLNLIPKKLIIHDFVISTMEDDAKTLFQVKIFTTILTSKICSLHIGGDLGGWPLKIAPNDCSVTVEFPSDAERIEMVPVVKKIDISLDAM